MIDEPKPPTEKVSYFCEKPATDDDLCFGCMKYVCSSCSINDPWGQHEPEAHQSSYDEDSLDGDE